MIKLTVDGFDIEIQNDENNISVKVIDASGKELSNNSYQQSLEGEDDELDTLEDISLEDETTEADETTEEDDETTETDETTEEEDETLEEAKGKVDEIKVGDKIKGSQGITKDRVGTIISIEGDMAQVDFGNGDKYGITLRRVTEGEFQKEEDETMEEDDTLEESFLSFEEFKKMQKK